MDSLHFAEENRMSVGDLAVGDQAVESHDRIRQNGRARGKNLPFGQCEAFLGRELAEAGKGIREILVMGTQRVQREMPALEEDGIARIVVVQADKHGRRAIGNGTGSRDRHAAPNLLMLCRHDLHVPCIAAHGVAIDDRIQTLHAQIHVSP